MKHHHVIFGAALFAAALSSSAARADGDDIDAPPAPRAPLVVAARAPDRAARRPSRSGVEMNIALGARGVVLPNRGFDPYAANNVLGQLSLAAGPTFARAGDVSFSALGQWDVGTATATTRGDQASLTMHHLAVALEARWQVVRRLGLFAKIAPGAVHLRGSFTDPVFERPLVSRSWAFEFDATAGLAFMFASVGSREAPRARFWLTGEMGYAFATISEMVYSPAPDDEDTRHYGSVTLPPFRPGGPIGRLAIAVSF